MKPLKILIIMVCCALLMTAAIAPATAGLDNFLLNAGFEDKQQSDPTKPELAPWTITNKSGDKIMCGVAITRAAGNGCFLRFKGSSGEKSVLAQSLDEARIGGLNYQLSEAEAAGALCVNYWLYSQSPQTSLKGMLKVKLQGGQIFKAKYKWRGITTDNEPGRVDEYAWVNAGCFGPWQEDQNFIFLEPTDVIKSVRFSVANTSTSGKALYDEPLLRFYFEF